MFRRFILKEDNQRENYGGNYSGPMDYCLSYLGCSADNELSHVSPSCCCTDLENEDIVTDLVGGSCVACLCSDDPCGYFGTFI
ncbi:hypothetical protein lerEdw1_013891 [Lerista edwardsae]|nr:hypothetical protein lerEdw1_013891 [Lerista edwardsae]